MNARARDIVAQLQRAGHTAYLAGGCVRDHLLGVDKDHAFAFSITCFAMTLLWSLAGGPFYFLYRHETHTPPPDVAEVEPIFSDK